MMVAWLKVVASEIEAFEIKLQMKVQSIDLTAGLESGCDERSKYKTKP